MAELKLAYPTVEEVHNSDAFLVGDVAYREGKSMVMNPYMHMSREVSIEDREFLERNMWWWGFGWHDGMAADVRQLRQFP